MKGQGLLCCEGLDVVSGNDACGSVVEVVEGAGSGQGAKGSASIAKRPAVQSVREQRWLPVTGGGDRRAVRGRDPAVCRTHRPAPAPEAGERGGLAGLLAHSAGSSRPRPART